MDLSRFLSTPLAAELTTPNNAAHPLRRLGVAAFLTAAPLCVAQGIISNNAVIIIGLIPQVLSVAASFLLPLLQPQPGTVTNVQSRRAKMRAGVAHPVTVFVFDAVLAIALLLIVLFV